MEYYSSLHELNERNQLNQPVKKKRYPIKPIIISTLISTLIATTATFTITTNTQPNTFTQISNPVGQTIIDTTETTTNLTEIINKAIPSVVTISVTTPDGSGTGSGVIIDNNGHILTNAHVATLGGLTTEGKITIQTNTGKTLPAELIGYDPEADLAIIKTETLPENTQPITFTQSNNLQVGNTTIAIGSPLGLPGTVTTGIISSLNRPITVPSSDTQKTNQDAVTTLSVIQTDAAINSGNSGGALLDSNGNLIGINVAIASLSETSGNIGVGFAIPSDYAQRIAKEIIETGTGTHGFLGISVEDNNDNNSFSDGAKITNIISNSPASTNELKNGDIITSINDQKIQSALQLTAIIKQFPPNSEITITYIRNDTPATIQLSLQ